ncbi:hypothetical protein [Natronoarchaeum rubrum]|uniref:hypothetical protein n=1 Tax=Natronoarchaeum rubrum TaxID=755311 RepID=UPI002112EEAF|nr:hypothetical protein [Natronoarchaeum rubrum]HMB49679.1 hypothetical protein [Natronoarchaeum rubrum]
MYPHDPSDPANSESATVDFDRELSDLLLRAFAAGSPVDGDWTIETESPSVPDWTVSIRRRPCDALDAGD